MQLTAGELLEALKKVPKDSIIRFQRIEDEYIEGRNENHLWYGEEDKQFPAFKERDGWKTYDMPCDMASESFCKHYPNGCPRCDARNQYIVASRYFYHDNQLFIDGHY